MGIGLWVRERTPEEKEQDARFAAWIAERHRRKDQQLKEFYATPKGKAERRRQRIDAVVGGTIGLLIGVLFLLFCLWLIA